MFEGLVKIFTEKGLEELWKTTDEQKNILEILKKGLKIGMKDSNAEMFKGYV